MTAQLKPGDLIMPEPSGRVFTVRSIERDPGTGLEYYRLWDNTTQQGGFAWVYQVDGWKGKRKTTK